MLRFTLGVDGADNDRYTWILNYTDQTVSCVDKSSHTVIATVTLTAAKSLRNMFYRPVSRSVYVITTNWFDRIDANPSSGSFNTVVGSGALTSNTNLTWATYVPFLDMVGYVGIGSPGLLAFDSSHNIVSSGTAVAFGLFKQIFPNRRIGRFVNSGTIEQPGPGQSSPFHLTRNNMMIAHAPTTIDLYDVKAIGGNQFYLKDTSIREGVSRLGYTNIIGKYITGQRATAMYILDLETKSSVFSFAVLPSDRVSHKYCPKDQKIFAYQRINTNVNLSVIDWKTKTDLGDISRSGYKATDENCTRMGLYSRYNGFFYVLGGNTTGTGTVNKLHYYDPSQALGSMYVASITVGNSATAPVDYYENCMCSNFCEPFYYPDEAY